MTLGLYAPLPARYREAHNLGRHYLGLTTSLTQKGGFPMKKYTTPEMETLSLASEEAITAPLDGSKTFNDGELEW